MSTPTPETPFASFATVFGDEKGGWNDCKGMFSTINEAINAGQTKDKSGDPYDDGHVVDVRIGKIVAYWYKSDDQYGVNKLVNP